MNRFLLLVLTAGLLSSMATKFEVYMRPKKKYGRLVSPGGKKREIFT